MNQETIEMLLDRQEKMAFLMGNMWMLLNHASFKEEYQLRLLKDIQESIVNLFYKEITL